jgi:hypothetical protein
MSLPKSVFTLILVGFLGACASQPVKPGQSSGSGRTGEFHPPMRPVETRTTEEPPAEKVNPVSVGIWIDAAGVEAYAGLGFLQSLEKSEKIKVSKVVGTGLGCWIAVSWALEASNNRAEWQATKLSGWDMLGRGGSFLNRISGGHSDYSKFKSEMGRMFPAAEFRALAREADCPLMNAQSGVLESGRSIGIHKALWGQLNTPLLGAKEELASVGQFPGILAIRPRLRELDDLSRLDKSSGEVQAWIVLSLDSLQILADEREPLRDTLIRRWVDASQGAAVSPEGRPVFLTVPAFDVNVKTARDFSQRRVFLLQGRKHAERFLSMPWVDRIQNSGNGLEGSTPR